MNETLWAANGIDTVRVSTQYITAYRKHDMSNMGRFIPGQTLSSSPLFGISQHVLDLFSQQLVLAPITTSPTFSREMFGGYGLVQSGDPTPVPTPVILSAEEIRRNNGVHWRDAPKTGDIVVSDYQNVKMLLTFKNGGTKIDGATTLNLVPTSSFMLIAGIPVSTKANVKYYDVGGEYYISTNGGAYVQYVKRQRSDSVTAFEDGFDIKPLQDWLNSGPRQWRPPEIYQEITELTSEANTGTLDILTSLAELPKTASSIYKGLRFMLRGLQDVKKKRFSLLTKQKRVRLEYERKVFRLEYKTRREFLKARNDKARRLIQAKLNRDKKQLRNDLMKSLKSLADALASVWLNYRYNIETTVMMIEDSIDALHFDKERWFHRWRTLVEYTIDPPEIVSFKAKGKWGSRFRALIKRSFTRGTKGFQNISASLFVTAWELIPLSFVLDWIINIGDFIATSFSAVLNKDYKQGATISLKFDGAVSYTGPSGSQVICELKGYTRSVINPNDFCRLVINPDVTGKRQLDALALSWNLFLKNTWKFK